MIFREIYSAYYNAIADILRRAVEGTLSERELRRIVETHAFGESAMTVLPALKSERWPLLREDMTTPLQHAPQMPLTTLQRRWLKAISQDPRFRLFGVELTGLADVTPLFTPQDIFVYDKYADGDPYEDEGYIARFRVILDALRNQTPLSIEMVNQKGRAMHLCALPRRLEYSEKDDKFRLIVSHSGGGSTVNLGRVTACRPYHGALTGAPARETERTVASVTLSIRDQRNALNRVMLHFAHFKKQAEQLGEGRYRVMIEYDRADEREMLIRVLSFGPLVKVEEPPAFVELIRHRLQRQKGCGL